jgi:hypothetical protein
MQPNLVRVNLDRVMMDPALGGGLHFPLCSVVCLRMVGSNHAPIMLSIGEGKMVRATHFHFEMEWLLHPGFKEEVSRNIAETFLSNKLVYNPARCCGISKYLFT